MKPNPSTRIPITGQPYITSPIPTKKVHVPRSFFRARKKLITWLVPIVSVIPIRNISCAGTQRALQ